MRAGYTLARAGFRLLPRQAPATQGAWLHRHWCGSKSILSAIASAQAIQLPIAAAATGANAVGGGILLRLTIAS